MKMGKKNKKRLSPLFSILTSILKAEISIAQQYYQKSAHA